MRRRLRPYPVAVLASLLVTVLLGCAGEDYPLNTQLSPSAQLLLSGGQSHDFGMVTVGRAEEKTFTVVNAGELTATDLTGSFSISAFQFLGGSFPGAGGTCRDTLAPGRSCDVVVAFVPPYAARFEEPLRIRYFNGLVTAVTSRPILFGTGVQ